MSLETFEDITVHIKVEPAWEGDQDVAEALRVLYAGHVVKEELVLGPELMQSADAALLQDSLIADNTHKLVSLERTCSVNLEHMVIDMNHHICRIGGRTYEFRYCLRNEEKDRSRKKIKSHDQSTINDEPVEKATKKNKSTVKKLRGAKYFCNECQYSTKNSENLLTHLQTHSGEKPFKCSQCDSAFPSQSHLNVHNLRKHSEKPFKCSECSARFACRNYMKTHLRIHSGEKPYKCNHCSAAFTQSSHLNRHLKKHNKSFIDEKPYKCSQCTSKFKDRWSLIRHQETHTGKKSYTCSECGAGFNQTGNLLRHQRIHTGEKRYKCSYCDAAFVQSCDLAKHIKIHSGKGPLECKVCVYKTNRLAALKSHIKKWHSDQNSKAKIGVI